MSKSEVKGVQNTLNGFTNGWLKGYKPLRVDGVKGHATNVRIMQVKYYLGWDKPGSAVDHSFLELVRHPRRRSAYPGNNKNKGQMLRRGMYRRGKEKARWAQQQIHAVVTPGVTRYNGVPVAKWLVPYLNYARQHNWRGSLVSGWRSPAYSDSLCIRMCGRPFCPGRCAGRTSNHSGSSRPRGALDVSDYYRFGQIMRTCPLGPRIFNALGAQDPVHFSASGR